MQRGRDTNANHRSARLAYAVAMAALVAGTAGCEGIVQRPSGPIGAPIHPALAAALPGMHVAVHLSPALRSLAAHVKVFTDRSTDRPVEVVGSLDVQPDAAGGEFLDAIRARTLLLGGDAVLGVEFHHDPVTGDAWITGLAVRYLERDASDAVAGRPAFAEALEPEEIVVVASDTLTRPSEVVATVRAVDPSGDGEAALASLRAQAAAAGAHAIVGLRERRETDGMAVREVSGLAVRYRDLLGDRAFDVLEHIEVPARGTRDEAALEQLRDRARAAGADMLVNVALLPGDAERGTRERLAADAVHVRVVPR